MGSLGNTLGKTLGDGLGSFLTPILGGVFGAFGGGGTATDVTKETVVPPASTPISEQTPESLKRKKITQDKSTMSTGALVPKTNKKTLLG